MKHLVVILMICFGHQAIADSQAYLGLQVDLGAAARAERLHLFAHVDTAQNRVRNAYEVGELGFHRSPMFRISSGSESTTVYLNGLPSSDSPYLVNSDEASGASKLGLGTLKWLVPLVALGALSGGGSDRGDVFPACFIRPEGSTCRENADGSCTCTGCGVQIGNPLAEDD